MRVRIRRFHEAERTVAEKDRMTAPASQPHVPIERRPRIPQRLADVVDFQALVGVFSHRACPSTIRAADLSHFDATRIAHPSLRGGHFAY